MLPTLADLTEASASTPLLATSQPVEPVAHEQDATCIAHVRAACRRAWKPLLLVAGNALLTLALVRCPGLILLFLVLQPVFIFLFIRYAVFPESESDLEQQFTPDSSVFFVVGTAARRVQDAVQMWGRVALLKYSMASALFCISIALLYICIINPGLLMLYCVLQPLLIVVAGKWMMDFDTAASLHHRRIRLERVAFDAALFNDVDMPRACAICLCDFEACPENVPEKAEKAGKAEKAESVNGSVSHTRNVVFVEGAGAAEWRQDEIVRLPCAPAHCFHAGCIHEWLTAHGTCPLCRIRSGDELPRWWVVWRWFTQLLPSSTTPS
jgi:hypothetical protein